MQLQQLLLLQLLQLHLCAAAALSTIDVTPDSHFEIPTTLTTPSGDEPPPPPPAFTGAPKTPPRYIFNFGDSISFTSFDADGPAPSRSCPMGNPSSNDGCLKGSSLAGGHTWISSLTTVYNRTTTMTYNFAQCAQVVDSEVVRSRPGIVQKQIEGAYRSVEARDGRRDWEGANSLYAFWLGINDVALTFRHENTSELLGKVADSYFAAVESLLDTPAHPKHILFISIPPLYRMSMWTPLPSNPNKLTPQQHRELVIAVKKMNLEIDRRVIQFAAVHKEKGVKTYVWDAFSSFNRVLDNLSDYGFEEDLDEGMMVQGGVKDGMQGRYGDGGWESLEGRRRLCNTGECFWWDSSHPSKRAQMIFGEEVAELLEKEGFW